MTNTQNAGRIRQIESREAKGKQFLCSLLKTSELDGRFPMYPELQMKEHVNSYIDERVRKLRAKGLHPKYAVIETIEPFITGGHYLTSRPYCFSVTFLTDFPETEQGV
jgi:hypothetical protein